MPTGATIAQFGAKTDQETCKSKTQERSVVIYLIFWAERSESIVGPVSKDVEEDPTGQNDSPDDYQLIWKRI